MGAHNWTLKRVINTSTSERVSLYLKLETRVTWISKERRTYHIAHLSLCVEMGDECCGLVSIYLIPDPKFLFILIVLDSSPIGTRVNMCVITFHAPSLSSFHRPLPLLFPMPRQQYRAHPSSHSPAPTCHSPPSPCLPSRPSSGPPTPRCQPTGRW
jgi:hypothetical protein